MSKRGDAAREAEKAAQAIRDLGKKATESDRARVTKAAADYERETKAERERGTGATR